MRFFVTSLTAFGLTVAAWAYLFGQTLAGSPLPTHGAAAHGRNALLILLWITGALTVISATNRYFWDYFVARLAKRPAPPLIKNAFAALILLMAVTGIIGEVFGRDVTGIWATSSVIGVVLGFALRNTLQDVFAGIAMNLDGSLKAGDWIEVRSHGLMGRYYGKVLDIAWRATHIQLENNNIIIVPNSVMGVTAVTNFAHANHTSRFDTEIVIDFDVPPERARRILLAGVHAATSCGIILPEPPPDVLVGEPTERGVSYKVRFWGKVTDNSPSKMQDKVMTELLRNLHVAGLTPAFPKQDLFVARQPKRLLDHSIAADRHEVLSRIELFGQSLNHDEMDQLAMRLSPATFRAGTMLVRQGDDASSLFIVTEGFLDVFVSRPDTTTPLLVNHIVAGQIFGEMSLLTGEARSASVVAATDVSVYEITQDHFEAFLVRRPGIADQISEIVAQHRVRTDAALREAAPAEIELETKRLKEEILDRMTAVFRGLLAKPLRSRSGN